jgi:hypothetical protein
MANNTKDLDKYQKQHLQNYLQDFLAQTDQKLNWMKMSMYNNWMLMPGKLVKNAKIQVFPMQFFISPPRVNFQSSEVPGLADSAQGSEVPGLADSAQGSEAPGLADSAQGSEAPGLADSAQGSEAPGLADSAQDGNAPTWGAGGDSISNRIISCNIFIKDCFCSTYTGTNTADFRYAVRVEKVLFTDCVVCVQKSTVLFENCTFIGSNICLEDDAYVIMQNCTVKQGCQVEANGRKLCTYHTPFAPSVPTLLVCNCTWNASEIRCEGPRFALMVSGDWKQDDGCHVNLCQGNILSIALNNMNEGGCASLDRTVTFHAPPQSTDSPSHTLIMLHTCNLRTLGVPDVPMDSESVPKQETPWTQWIKKCIQEGAFVLTDNEQIAAVWGGIRLLCDLQAGNWQTIHMANYSSPSSLPGVPSQQLILPPWSVRVFDFCASGQTNSGQPATIVYAWWGATSVQGILRKSFLRLQDCVLRLDYPTCPFCPNKRASCPSCARWHDLEKTALFRNFQTVSLHSCGVELHSYKSLMQKQEVPQLSKDKCSNYVIDVPVLDRGILSVTGNSKFDVCCPLPSDFKNQSSDTFESVFKPPPPPPRVTQVYLGASQIQGDAFGRGASSQGFEHVHSGQGFEHVHSSQGFEHVQANEPGPGTKRKNESV